MDIGRGTRANARKDTHLLAAGRVYHFEASPPQTTSSYLALFTLTLFFKQSGLVSVALSLELPPVAVSNYLPLYCPDFPPECRKM